MEKEKTSIYDVYVDQAVKIYSVGPLLLGLIFHSMLVFAVAQVFGIMMLVCVCVANAERMNLEDQIERAKRLEKEQEEQDDGLR